MSVVSYGHIVCHIHPCNLFHPFNPCNPWFLLYFVNSLQNYLVRIELFPIFAVLIPISP